MPLVISDPFISPTPSDPFTFTTLHEPFTLRSVPEAVLRCDGLMAESETSQETGALNGVTEPSLTVLEDQRLCALQEFHATHCHHIFRRGRADPGNETECRGRSVWIPKKCPRPDS